MKSPVTRLVVQEHADRSFLQRQRTYLRHGLNGEAPVRNVLGDYVEPEPIPPPVPEPAIVPPTTTTTPAAPTVVERTRSRVPGWVKTSLGVAIGGPIAAAAVALGHYMNDDDGNTTTINNPPVAVQPVAPPVDPQPTPQPSSSKTGGDLLDWLESEGHNR